MSNVIRIHPQDPQHRLIKQVVGVLDKGDVIAYPTDSGYALGCTLGNKSAMEKIRDIRKLSKHHHFTLMMKNLSALKILLSALGYWQMHRDGGPTGYL